MYEKPCPDCNGHGATVDPWRRCDTCDGTGEVWAGRLDMERPELILLIPAALGACVLVALNYWLGWDI
jgi:hypothetical protein